jgi:hypothetical protein
LHAERISTGGERISGRTYSRSLPSGEQGLETLAKETLNNSVEPRMHTNKNKAMDRGIRTTMMQLRAGATKM